MEKQKKFESKATKNQILEKVERLHLEEDELNIELGQIDLLIIRKLNRKKTIKRKISKNVIYRNGLIEQINIKNYIK